MNPGKVISDPFIVTSRQVVHAAEMVRALEDELRRPASEAVSPTHLAKQQTAVRNLARNLRERNRELSTRQRLLRLRQKQLQRHWQSRQSWQSWGLPSNGILIAILTWMLGLFFGLCSGANGSAGLGFLVAVVTICIGCSVFAYWFHIKLQSEKNIADLDSVIPIAERHLADTEGLLKNKLSKLVLCK